MDLNAERITGFVKDRNMWVRVAVIFFAFMVAKNLHLSQMGKVNETKRSIQEKNNIIELINQIGAQKKEIKKYQPSFFAGAKEASAFLSSINDLAKASKVNILYLQPEAQGDFIFYVVLPIKMNLEGDYHRIATFLSKLESTKEMVRIERLNFIVSDKETLQTEVSLSVVYIKE